jgi:hypothetical protein
VQLRPKGSLPLCYNAVPAALSGWDAGTGTGMSYWHLQPLMHRVGALQVVRLEMRCAGCARLYASEVMSVLITDMCSCCSATPLLLLCLVLAAALVCCRHQLTGIAYSRARGCLQHFHIRSVSTCTVVTVFGHVRCHAAAGASCQMWPQEQQLFKPTMHWAMTC